MKQQAILYYEKFTKEELIEMDRLIFLNEENRDKSGGIHLLNPQARKKSAAIVQAITWHLSDERKAKGNPVPVCGYSGRLTKRRA